VGQTTRSVTAFQQLWMKRVVTTPRLDITL
jgi:hypothetical protein